MKFIFIMIALLLSTAAQAQQQQSPTEQALGAKLLLEIQQGLACSAEAVTLKSDLAKAFTKIKDLEAKPKEEK